MSVVSVVCYQVEVSATCRSLVQRSPTECVCVCVCVCVIECYHVQQQPQHLQLVGTRCQTTKERY